jgi:hypothetical protein
VGIDSADDLLDRRATGLDDCRILHELCHGYPSYQFTQTELTINQRRLILQPGSAGLVMRA